MKFKETLSLAELYYVDYLSGQSLWRCGQNDDDQFKSLYLAMMDSTKKWTGKTWSWGQNLDQFCISFGAASHQKTCCSLNEQ